MLPSVNVALQTLRANPVRTLLSTLGIVMGAASLAGVFSLGDGAEALGRAQIERQGFQTVAVNPKTFDTIDGLAIPRTTFPVFTTGQARSLATSLMPGSAVLMSVEGRGSFVTAPGGKDRAAMVQAVFGSPAAGAFDVAHGRFLSESEAAGDARVTVVSNKLGTELAGGRELSTVVGTTLTFQGQPWLIVGVMQPFPNEQVFRAFVPFQLAATAMAPATEARPRTLVVRAPRIEDVEQVRRQVEAWADATDRRWRAEPAIVIAATGLDRLRQLNQGFMVFRLLMGAFTAISLVVGGIGIMNVLLASVVERTREIGVRKTAGARFRDIVVQFLSESVIISLSGALLGAVLGIAAAFAATAIMRAQTGAPIQAVVTWRTIAVSMGAAVVVGLVFGVYPALKAARLSPVEAMRYE